MEEINLKLVSYCGFYCGACPVFLKGKCEGCKGESPKCALGYKACKVRPCCMENGNSTCVECNMFDSVKDCKKYNPFAIRLGQFLMRSSRRKGIELIKEKGEAAFVEYMADKNWVTNKLGKNSN